MTSSSFVLGSKGHPIMTSSISLVIIFKLLRFILKVFSIGKKGLVAWFINEMLRILIISQDKNTAKHIYLSHTFVTHFIFRHIFLSHISFFVTYFRHPFYLLSHFFVTLFMFRHTFLSHILTLVNMFL